MRIALLQCELEHRHQAPHLAMCLFAADLRRDGHEVFCALVHPRGLDEAARELADRCDLLVLDSIFPFALVRRLRQAVGAITVVGGHNALQHALRGPADLAIVGPGRGPLRELARTLDSGGEPLDVVGVWGRSPDGELDCGPPPGRPSLRRELLPFEPDLDWRSFGPPRAPGSNLRVPSVVAGLGCPWNRSVLAEGRLYSGVTPRLPSVVMTSRARERIERGFVGREGGCTFCVLRYSGAAPLSREATVDLLELQGRELLSLGARGLSLQTEDPFSLVVPLLERLSEAGLTRRLDELHIRTMPSLILRHRDALEQAIVLAERLGPRLVLAQVGFEAFDETSLAVYHKGLDPEDNLRAARLLGELDDHHAGFVGTHGHGMVPLHPWTTAESLAVNLAACRADAPWLLPAVHPGARVELYDEWSPLFWKMQDEGLLRPAPDRFGWDWDYADPDVGELVASAAHLLRHAPPPGPHPGADALEAALEVHRREPDPAGRRRALMQLLGSRGVGIIGP